MTGSTLTNMPLYIKVSKARLFLESQLKKIDQSSESKKNGISKTLQEMQNHVLGNGRFDFHLERYIPTPQKATKNRRKEYIDRCGSSSCYIWQTLKVIIDQMEAHQSHVSDLLLTWCGSSHAIQLQTVVVNCGIDKRFISSSSRFLVKNTKT